MSATAGIQPLHSGAIEGLPLKVKGTTLLAMMLAVPFCIIAAFVDAYAFDGALRRYSLEQPMKVVWWVAILSTPHIIASFFTFADREYISHYSKYIKRASVIGLSLGLGLPIAAGYLLKPDWLKDGDIVAMAAVGAEASLMAAAAYTTYHNLQQQYGISLMLMQQKAEFVHHLWKWITIIPASLLFIGMNFHHEGTYWDMWSKSLAVAAVNAVLAIAVAAYIVITYMRRPGGYSKIGIAYFCANAGMVVACFGLIMAGEILIAMLMPRLVHDLTAYWIYMVHDENRNAARMRNPLYAPLKKIGIGPAAACIPLSFILGYIFLSMGHSFYTVSVFVVTLNYMHYYIEGIIWKRGTPHRQHVPFV